MPQKEDAILPLFVNSDVAFEKMKGTDSPFLKGISLDLSANPSNGLGTSNPTGEGQNFLKLTKTRSNIVVPNVSLPTEGNNKNVGNFESVETQDSFQFNYNDKGFHGIYILSGNAGVWQPVLVDPKLAFSDKQEAFINDLRCRMRVTYNEDGSVLEKTLIWTDGNVWQGYLNVIASIKTNGFNPVNPYWRLQPPHFDREEMWQYTTRKIMYRPEVKLIPNTPDDANKINELINTAFQFAVAPQNTDGRFPDFSPYSLPIYVKTEEYLTNPDLFQKNISIRIYAGSPLTEKINLYVRQSKKQLTGISDLVEWGDWFKYDTIEKFTDCAANDPLVIGNDYWKRTSPWSLNHYDPIQNTIEYIFDNSKKTQFLLNEDPAMIQNGLGLRSKAVSDLNDAIIFANNEFDYNNFPCEVTGNLDVVVEEKPSTFCPIPPRKITLYAYIGYMADSFAWYSQVGYFVGADTQMRFGGVYQQGDGSITINSDDSKVFDLDFADKSAFLCYLKGTPYYAIGKWYVSNSDNSLTPVGAFLDQSLPATNTYIQGVYNSGGIFICKFDFEVPAGRYDAAIGRHNVATSGDFKNTSTYVMGIANSRSKSTFLSATVITPNAIGSFSKEMEIDCTAGNVDTWGNNHDLFYIFAPHTTNQGNKHFRFIEGYLHESRLNPLPVELFPYTTTQFPPDASGTITDKNGFYFAYTKRQISDIMDIQFVCKLNCAYPTLFSVQTAGAGSGWRPGNNAYISDHNNGVVGDCNRVLLNGKITSLDGTIGYNNIGISIADGSTVYTQSDGSFQLVIHNGQNTIRGSNIYINAGGNYLITLAGCGFVPLSYFDESKVPCVNCNPRIYPVNLNQGIIIQNNTQTSLKEGGTYSVGFEVADLAGRMTYVQVIKQIRVPTFLERNDVLATFFRIMVNAGLQLTKYMPEAKWFSPVVSKTINILRYIDWVGDKIVYIDNNGNVITDSANAVFVSITINSLYDYNVQRNFSTLANYQFSQGDMIKILDDGDGNLFDTATYGSQINLPVLGQNYNQAAITAGLIPTTATVPVINNNINTVTAAQTAQDTSITVLVAYDKRLDKLIDKTGFWIELYTPSQVSDIIPYLETAGFYPVINGEVATFLGYTNGVPQYNYPKTIDIEFWDTYFLQRSITIKDVGNKFFAHPFESKNITDTFGSNITSGGRVGNTKNDNAKKTWFRADTQKSDDFVNGGLINGLGTFRTENRKDFSAYPWGGIMGVITQRNIILFICENDWFTTDYNFHYSYANAQGVMVTNLNEGLSTPHQKVGDAYGLSEVDMSAILSYDKVVVWYDRKNQGLIICDYRSAADVSKFDEKKGTQGYMQSYFKTKTNFITNWNKNNPLSKAFDVLLGIDMERGNIYITFRPRRNNSNDPRSYVSHARNIRLDHQETLVYNTGIGRFTRYEGFTPESYGRIRGNATGTQLVSFAAGVPYTHNTGNTSFNKFYGIQTGVAIMGLFNKDTAIVKIFQSLAYDSNPGKWFADLIYTNVENSFSYMSENQFKVKEEIASGAIMRDMNSYLDNNTDEQFRSTLQDGKRIAAQYIVFRLIDAHGTKNDYCELDNIFILDANSGGNKK